jgi:Zn-finger nucleic acid-binding protein
MAEVIARANPGSLIQIDQCGTCGGIWCDKWELFPIDGEEVARLDRFDGQRLRTPEPAAKKILYCPRCADALAVFADPILPKEIQLRRCRHCDGLWLKPGEFRRYKEHQKSTRSKKMSDEKIIAKLPQVYADPKAWVVTGTQGIFAYPRPVQEDVNLAEATITDAVKLVLQSLLRMVLGV